MTGCFSDHIAEEVYELEYGSMKHYTGNYTSFQNQKQQDLIRQQQMYNRQQKEIERLEGLIERFRYKATKAAMAQSKIKALERMEKIDAPQKSDTKSFSAHFVPRLKGGKTVLEIKDLKVGYDRPLCEISLEILSGRGLRCWGLTAAARVR